MKGIVLLAALVLSSVLLVAGQTGCLSNAVTPTGYCARIWANNLRNPRGIFKLSNNDVLVVEQGAGAIRLLWEENGAVQNIVLATQSGLNHGVTYGNGSLYASSQNTVYRWAYTVGNRTALGAPETVISNLPSATHVTRTVVYDATNGPSLIVSVGANTNIDSNVGAGRPGLYRFPISSFPTQFSTGSIVAIGLRNEVGVKFDHQGRLWGVENGFDNLNRNDLGGDIHQQNPGEEMNLFATDGGFYGYPYCWSQYNLTTVTTPRLTQYAHEDFIGTPTPDGQTINDAWCQNTSNVILPKYSLRAHTAPLDIEFYSGTEWVGVNGDAFIASHGSWNREPRAGYAVVRVHMQNGEPISDDNFLSYSGPGEYNNSWYRPVGLAFTKCSGVDCLLVTDDSQGVIISISSSTTTSSVPSSTTSFSSDSQKLVFSFLLSVFAALAFLLM